MKIQKNKLFKYLVVFLLCALLAFLLYHFTGKKEETKKDKDDDVYPAGTNQIDDKTADMNVIWVKINGNLYTASLEGDATSNEFYMLSPLTITMEDLNNNEKYYYLSNSLDGEDDYTGEIHKGDIMLYDTNCLVIFYKDFNTSFLYKKIGHIDNLPDLGDGNIEVSFVR
jgi:hypothetical protein